MAPDACNTGLATNQILDIYGTDIKNTVYRWATFAYLIFVLLTRPTK